MNGRLSTQPITIHQFHYTASVADAVTSQMLFIRSALKEAGIEGEIFAGLNHTPASLGIRGFDPARLWNSDLILVHHSHGNPLLEQVLGIDIPKALVYHNVTPARFFSHDPHLAQFSEQGRNQLHDFVGKVTAAFGDSKYNCAELEVIGLPKPTVFPLLNLRAHTSHTAERFKPAYPDKKVLLFVGKITPHKNQALLVETLYYLERAFPGKYQLVLAGRADPLYAQYLRLLAKSLGIASRVTLTGKLTQSKLEDWYLEAAALVCPSLHEGFCIPIVEAMQRQVPVFAIPITGVRETLGKAGIRLVTRMPHKIAEIIDAALSDAEILDNVLQQQEKRLEELAALHNAERVQALCIALVDRLRHSGRRPALPEIYT